MCKEEGNTKLLKEFEQKDQIGHDRWEDLGCDGQIKF